MAEFSDPTSNAGPDTEETPRDWRDLLQEAEEELRYARCLADDSFRKERVLRLRAIERAETYIAAAKEELTL